MPKYVFEVPYRRTLVAEIRDSWKTRTGYDPGYQVGNQMLDQMIELMTTQFQQEGPEAAVATHPRVAAHMIDAWRGEDRKKLLQALVDHHALEGTAEVMAAEVSESIRQLHEQLLSRNGTDGDQQLAWLDATARGQQPQAQGEGEQQATPIEDVLAAHEAAQAEAAQHEQDLQASDVNLDEIEIEVVDEPVPAAPKPAPVKRSRNRKNN